ncbi:MAG: hypothetical protein WAT20_15500 [Ferruginibacter sp.]|nr:hypothetical protein [Chitinophagaceae bacterium]
MIKYFTVWLAFYIQFTAIAAPSQLTKNALQPLILTYSGTTVIIGFSMYDNKGLAAQLVSEDDGVITVIFPDDDITCKINNRGQVLEGENYITQKGGGAKIVFIQIYESKKKIVNPGLDINKTLGNFMLVETIGGNVIFGWSDYMKEDQSFIFRSKPLSKMVMLKSEKGKWIVSSSEDHRIKKGSTMEAVYLYSQTTRRFFTRP